MIKKEDCQYYNRVVQFSQPQAPAALSKVSDQEMKLFIELWRSLPHVRSTNKNRPSSKDLNSDSELPIIKFLDNSMGIEVPRTNKGNISMLKGEINDENSVSLILRIADWNVSSEIADQTVVSIAELIDLLLLNLIILVGNLAFQLSIWFLQLEDDLQERNNIALRKNIILSL
ncbi:hypothetical protein GQ457_05G015640 [Hibiscus cannabinus]